MVSVSNCVQFYHPWTHHACPSPGHLQFPEKVLQLLPLNVAVTWKTDASEQNAITPYHQGPFSELLTCWNPISAECHKQIPAWISFSPLIDSNMRLLPVTLFFPLWLNRLDYWLMRCKLITPQRLYVHRVVHEEKLYVENCFSRILKVIMIHWLFHTDQYCLLEGEWRKSIVQCDKFYMNLFLGLSREWW